MKRLVIALLVLGPACDQLQALDLAEECASESLKARAEAVISIHRNVRGGEESTSAILEAFARIDNEDLYAGSLEEYDTRTLELLFEAVAIASERGGSENLLNAMEDIFRESLSRGFVGNMVDRMYASYVRRRAWRKARELDERFPSRARELPRVVQVDSVSAGVPSFYEVSEDGQTLTHRRADLSGPTIVSIVSPGCHFSRAIVELIESDPELSALFEAHSINVDPAPYRVNAARLAEENRGGSFSYVILHLASDWGDFDFSSVPQFYFLRDGKVLHRIRSVTPDEFKGRLQEGLGAIGLDELRSSEGQRK